MPADPFAATRVLFDLPPGTIYLDGRAVEIDSPLAAQALGISRRTLHRKLRQYKEEGLA